MHCCIRTSYKFAMVFEKFIVSKNSVMHKPLTVGDKNEYNDKKLEICWAIQVVAKILY